MRRVLIILCTASVLPSAPLAAQTQWESQVVDQIEAARSLFRADGYELTGELRNGALYASRSEEFTVDLAAGVSYALVGVCDADCSNIDLTISDPYGEVVDSDKLADDVPVVEVIPEVSGRFQVRVFMASCVAEPCYYGVGTFSNSVAGNEWQKQVLNQLLEAGSLFADEGFAMRGGPMTGVLNAGTYEELSLRLDAGVTYAVLGVCDEDCSDMDLVISDVSGEAVDSDYERDDVPIVQVTPQHASTYTVRVYMATCASDPCYYGVGTYGSDAMTRAARSRASTRR